MYSCKSIGCRHTTQPSSDFCDVCAIWGQQEMPTFASQFPLDSDPPTMTNDKDRSLSEQYPQYYKSVGDLTEVDVYAVHNLFCIKDHSGCIQHASKKLLLSGVRTGGKSAHDDIREARDTLNRWLQLNS